MYSDFQKFVIILVRRCHLRPEVVLLRRVALTAKIKSKTVFAFINIPLQNFQFAARAFERLLTYVLNLIKRLHFMILLVPRPHKVNRSLRKKTVLAQIKINAVFAGEQHSQNRFLETALAFRIMHLQSLCENSQLLKSELMSKIVKFTLLIQVRIKTS